jgi:phosphohistidine swiveling domain-containing protein
VTAGDSGRAMRAGSSARVMPIAAGSTLPETAGGKARGLQRIAATALALPDSWCLLPGTDAEDLGALTQELERRGHRLLAVRSSAQDEDREHASFAGIHISRLGVGLADLPAAVEEVATSSLTARAQAYREHLGLPPATEPCAVVVQPVIPGDCAGVAFGIDGTRPGVVIEAVRGLGETLVAGRAVPESVTLGRNAQGWVIERRRKGRQAEALLPTDSEIRRVALNADRPLPNVLSPTVCAAIARGVATLEAQEGRPLDVEWVSWGGKVWFVQARPQTRPLAPDLPPGEIWTRVNVRDVLPEIPSAYSRSLLPAALDAAVRDVIRSYGMSPEPAVPYATCVYGRPVFNERVFTVADRLGVPREAMQANMGGIGEASPRLPPPRPWAGLRHPLMMVRALRILAGIERRVSETIQENRELRTRLEGIDLPSVSPEDLHREVAPLVERAQGIAAEAQYLAGALSFAQDQALALLDGFASPQSLLSRLVAGGEGSVTTRQLEELLEIAAAMRRSQVDHFVGEITGDHAWADHWRTELPEEVWKPIRTWLERYGHRGPWESDIARPRYADDLRLFAGILFPLVRAETPPETAGESRARRQAEADQARRSARDGLGWLSHRRLNGLVTQIKRRMALREELRSSFIGWFHPLRRFVLEMGRRLTEAGRLADPEDVWLLSRGELIRALEDTHFRVDVVVARERSRRAAWRRVEVPNRFTSEDARELSVARWDEGDASTVHRGNGVSPGVAEGPICVLFSPEDGIRLEAGAILVAPSTDPAWTPLFARASGVIVEIGGMLSHSGIVAREYGIPCVANVQDATRVLHDGDRVHLDGASGIVRTVARAAHIDSGGKNHRVGRAKAPAGRES